MEEKRRSPRVNLPLKVKYRLLHSDIRQGSASIKDISSGGACLIVRGDSGIKVRDALIIEINLPDGYNSLLVEAQVNRLGFTKTSCICGFEFTKISSVDRSRIVCIIFKELQRDTSQAKEELKKMLLSKEADTKAIDEEDEPLLEDFPDLKDEHVGMLRWFWNQ